MGIRATAHRTWAAVNLWVPVGELAAGIGRRQRGWSLACACWGGNWPVGRAASSRWWATLCGGLALLWLDRAQQGFSLISKFQNNSNDHF
jgi:hypothetical protein